MRPLKLEEKVMIIDDTVDKIVERVNEHGREIRNIQELQQAMLAILEKHGIVVPQESGE